MTRFVETPTVTTTGVATLFRQMATDFFLRLLLGRPDAWGARAFTSPRAILTLAAIAITLHGCDLLTGVHMMLTYGTNLELNPVARGLLVHTGPLGLGVVKMGVVSTVGILFVQMAQSGHPRLARNCLFVVSLLGALGWISNQVG